MGVSIQTINADDQITSSRADINQNFANLNDGKIDVTFISTDTTLSENSDTKIPSQKAIKAYVDAGGAVGFPDSYVTTSAGVSDAGKGVKLNASGELDNSFLASTPILRVYKLSGSPHTWTKPSGLKAVMVECIAGGGGGGASNDTTTDTYGGGGGSGAYAKKLILVGSLGSTETVTVGNGGSGETSSGGTPQGNAGTGGTTSFGSHISCAGGTGASARTNGNGGAVPTTGDINSGGQAGSVGGSASDSRENGIGASSVLGTIGKGGDGDQSGGDVGGSAGNEGICIVTEYYN